MRRRPARPLARRLLRSVAVLAVLLGCLVAHPSVPTVYAEQELPDAAAAWNEKGIALTKAGKLADAAEAFQSALEHAPGHVTIQRNLALAHSNLSVRLVNEGRLSEAEDHVRKAFELDDEDPYICLNLGLCLDEQGYPDRGAVYVKRAARLAPHLPLVQERLGTVRYREGKLKEAVAAWELAAAASPQNTELAQRLARTKGSLELERTLHSQTSSHFVIHFDLERHAVLASKVIRELEEVRGAVAAEFQRFGPQQLQVFVLTPEQFRRVTGTHGWVAGLYDGQIRLPVPKAGNVTQDVLSKARHEYVHAVLSPLGKRAPSWLHEGLAQIRERKSVIQARRRIKLTRPLEFAALSTAFSQTRNARAAQLKYDTALAFVGWLRQGERAPRFTAAVDLLFDGQPLLPAFESAYDDELLDLYEEFQDSIGR